MIKFINNLKSFKGNKLKAISYKLNKGMTYVELIVVLGIFATMSSIILFNYGEFQAKVDIKNLASDIALKIVEAQKSALNGQLPSSGSFCSTCKPSYGVYFNIATPKQFIYFVDLDNANGYSTGAETLDTINITKNNSISKIEKCTNITCSTPSINTLSITFKRPDSSAVFTGESITGSEYVKITIVSPKSATAAIKIYPSGRVQVN